MPYSAQQILALQPKLPIYTTAELTHASWTNPVRLVQAVHDLTISGNMYTGISATVERPNIVVGEMPSARFALAFEGPGEELWDMLMAIGKSTNMAHRVAPVRCTVKNWLDGAVVDRYPFYVTNPTQNLTDMSVTLTLTTPNYAAFAAATIYTSAQFPGIPT